MRMRPRLFPKSRPFRTRRGHASLACAIVFAACTGQIGEGGAPPSGPAPSSSADGGAAAPGGGVTAPEGGAPPPTVPFEPFSVEASVTKVKTVLTGIAPTQAELDSVRADPKSLAALVDGWIALPQYGAKMELFFADAFQQSQAQALDFSSVDDGPTPLDPLLLNFRQSFARTVTELIAEGRPFTETVTTTRFMMTTAMMTEYAYADSSTIKDATASGAGDKVCRFFKNDPNWSFQITARNVPLADSGNPASPDYLVFSLPTLANQYSDGAVGEAGAAHCAGIDPVVFNQYSSFALGNNLCGWLYSFMQGNNFWYFDPPQGQPNAYWCEAGSKFQDRPSYPSALTAADFQDWRMVTVNQPSSPAEQSRFFDVVGNRGKNTLTTYEQRVGYFTTPAFFAQYPTNISNQARATINQTMIIGLGHAFDGTDPITVQSAPGLDSKHAGNPACFQCHWSLDPMRRFFRSNFTLNYSTQEDPAETAVPGTFLFDNVVATGLSTMSDFANQIATHPQFKVAWTRKLCEWANSGPCLPTDPELQRVAQVFASSNYSWTTLVHELFTSPLVTYRTPTETTTKNGTFVPITRRAQFCATLGGRLGLGDVCGLAAIQDGVGTDTPAIATHLPSDGYSRGQVSPLFINEPDPFFRSSIEQMCALAADRVVDAGGTSLYLSTSPSAVTTSIAGMVSGLMGLDSSRAAQPIAILASHYASAVSGGHSPTDSLKSTFTAACLSPWVVSVGE